MVGMDIAVGYMVGWAWRKARRVAGQVDAEMDEVLDASLERLHRAVVAKLGDDPALRQLEHEASTNLETQSIPQRLQTRVVLALEDAAERDPEFSEELQTLLALVQRADGASLLAGRADVAAGRDLTVRASTGSIAAGTIRGSVSLNSPPQTDQLRPEGEPDTGHPHLPIDVESRISASRGSLAAYRIDQVVIGGPATHYESRDNADSAHQTSQRPSYFTDFHVVETVLDLGRLCDAHPAVLLFTAKAERGSGAVNAQRHFRKYDYPSIQELVSDGSIGVAWANLGDLLTNIVSGNFAKDSISVFLKSRGVRFAGCHLFLGDSLTGSNRVNTYGVPFYKAHTTNLAAAQALLRDHRGAFPLRLDE